MKKLFTCIILLLICTYPLHVSAETPTAASTTPSLPSSQKNESLVDQINQLKDKIASRVAQLKLVEKRGVLGTVVEVHDTHMTLQNAKGDLKLIDVDEITKFTSSGKETFGISDVTKGMKLSVIGLYNKESKRILARYISSFTIPQFLSGTVTDVSKSDYTITVAGASNISTVVDIETTTKMNSYSQGSITRSGFAKIVTGDRVEIIGYPNKTEKNRITGSYILQLNDLTGSPVSPTITP